jgi:hypothetical protein
MKEKFKEMIEDTVESIWFFVYDSIFYLLEKLIGAILFVLCVPIAIFGLIYEKLKNLVSGLS